MPCSKHGSKSAGTLPTPSSTLKVAVEAVIWKTSAETILTENPGGCVVNSFDSLFVSPITINSLCIACKGKKDKDRQFV